jgi:hypothetical protein
MHQMPEPIRPTEVNPLVGDRIHDLYETSTELRATRGPRDASERASLVTRTRWTIGKRLISIGSAVSGTHVSGTHA